MRDINWCCISEIIIKQNKSKQWKDGDVNTFQTEAIRNSTGNEYLYTSQTFNVDTLFSPKSENK